MTARQFDPRRLDVAAFAKEAAHLEGEWPLVGFKRVLESSLAHSDTPPAPVVWRASGERRALRGGEHQPWLHLHADAQVTFECQRCLNPVLLPLEVERSFLFVHGEDAAAQLDAESEDDVLPLSRALDLHELVEDELLLAMPLVPLHDVCPQPLAAPASTDDAVAEERVAPFAALASLKRKGLN